jgi:triacylglycerol lipase
MCRFKLMGYGAELRGLASIKLCKGLKENVNMRKDAVLLLHGLGRSRWSMWWFARYLQRAGYSVSNPGYASRSAPIEQLAAPLDDVFARCAQQVERVHVVTHSMGAIVLREFLARSRPEKLGRIVMLAPPNQGSEIVDHLAMKPILGWILGPAGRQLGTGAEHKPRSLLAVDADIGVIAGSRNAEPWFSRMVQSPSDGKVSVASTHLARQRDHLVIAQTHMFLPLSPAAMRATLAFLRHGSFTTP